MRNGPTEKQVKDAQDILHADLWNDIRGLAQEVERQIRDGEIDSADEVSEAIHMACDNHQRVIYTGQAFETVAFCDGNPFEEYEEEFGEKPNSVEVAAWFALNRDVSDMVYSGDVFKAFDAGEELPAEEKED